MSVIVMCLPNIFAHIIHFIFSAYLKEPTATPLVPSGTNGNSNLISIIGHNPLWIVVICIVCFLIASLLIGLLLMTRAKRRRSAELKKYVY